MSNFHFTLIVDGPDLQDESLIDRLFEAGCDDATIGSSDGVQYVDFDREAEALDDAILSAIDDLEKLEGVEVIRIADAGLASLADIAARVARTRESVRLLVSGARGPGNFPKPVTDPRSRYRLWRWSEVASWFKEYRGEFPAVADEKLAAMYNAALEIRHGRRRLEPSAAVSLRDLVRTRSPQPHRDPGQRPNGQPRRPLTDVAGPGDGAAAAKPAAASVAETGATGRSSPSSRPVQADNSGREPIRASTPAGSDISLPGTESRCLARSTLDAVLRDFQRFPGFVQAHDWTQLTVECSPHNHRRPRPLRDGERAVYGFFRGQEWLRIGQTGHSPRFTSQHYGTGRAGSTFARDIWNHRAEFDFDGREEDIGPWIRANFGRANIIFPGCWPAAMPPFLEAYLHYRLRPRFAGRRP